MDHHDYCINIVKTRTLKNTIIFFKKNIALIKDFSYYAEQIAVPHPTIPEAYF